MDDRKKASAWIRDDPEWKYANIRRLYVFIEHSIDQGLQWVVFEPNDEQLWSRVRQEVEDFLTGLWRSGRLVVLVGVAALKPAEFVIFRIGQWTGLDDDD